MYYFDGVFFETMSLSSWRDNNLLQATWIVKWKMSQPTRLTEGKSCCFVMLWLQSVEELIEKTLPPSIRLQRTMKMDDPICKFVYISAICCNGNTCECFELLACVRSLPYLNAWLLYCYNNCSRHSFTDLLINITVKTSNVCSEMRFFDYLPKNRFIHHFRL